MADPTPFLSTIAAVSATLVAIVGGLLVARFVTIDTEQQGAQKLLDDAQGRLTTATRRAQEARENLRRWEINDFFELEVVEAIGSGEREVRELRKIGHYTSLTDEDLTEVVQTVADEFDCARRVLRELRVGDSDAPQVDWQEFKRLWSDAPETSWDEVWETAYNELAGSAQAPQPVRSFVDPLAYQRPYVSSLTVQAQPEYVALGIQQRDALRANVDRTEQHAEDIEAEVAQLQRARDALVSPKGLGWGLLVLGVFTLVGVIVPLWLMSRATNELTARLGETVFRLFLAGLLALLGYMSALALRLSGQWHGTTARRAGRQGRRRRRSAAKPGGPAGDRSPT